VETSHVDCVGYKSSLVRFCGATYETMLAASFGLGHYPTFCAAFLDISLSAAAIYSRPALGWLKALNGRSDRLSRNELTEINRQKHLRMRNHRSLAVSGATPCVPACRITICDEPLMPVFMGVLYLGYRLATYFFQIAANPPFVRLGPADPLSC